MVDLLIRAVSYGILTGGIYVLVAVGLTLIFGVMDVVNFAHGAYLMLAMYATHVLWSTFDLNPFVAILVVAPLFFVFGAVSYRVLIHPIMGRSMFAQIFVTVGMIWVFENVALYVFSPTPVRVRGLYGRLEFAGVPFEEVRVYGFAIAVVTTILLYAFLYRTTTGLNIRATAESSDIAELMGIDVDRIYMLTFGLGIALVGVAGTITVQLDSAEPTVWSYYVLIAFVIVVLGGLGNVTGTLLAGPLIGVIESLAGLYLSPSMGPPIYYAIFIAILVLRATGHMDSFTARLRGLTSGGVSG
jgi:branched-subunit amino acid ABC-type transport system permease component